MSKESQPQDLGAIYKAKGIAGVEKTQAFQDAKKEKGFVLIPAIVPGVFEMLPQERSARQSDAADQRFTLPIIQGESERYKDGVFTLPEGRRVPGRGAKILYCIENTKRSYSEIAAKTCADMDPEKARRTISAFISQFNTKDRKQGIKIVRSRENKETFAELTFPEIEAARIQDLDKNEKIASDLLTQSDIQMISFGMSANWDKIRIPVEEIKMLDGLKDVVDQEVLNRLVERTEQTGDDLSFEAQRAHAVKRLGLILKYYNDSSINKLVEDTKKKDPDLASLILSAYYLQKEGIKVIDLLFDQDSSDTEKESDLIMQDEVAPTAEDHSEETPSDSETEEIKAPDLAKAQGKTILLPNDLSQIMELFDGIASEDVRKIITKINSFNENPYGMLRPTGLRRNGLPTFKHIVLNKYCIEVVGLGRQTYEIHKVSTIENAHSRKR